MIYMMCKLVEPFPQLCCCVMHCLLLQFAAAVWHGCLYLSMHLLLYGIYTMACGPCPHH